MQFCSNCGSQVIHKIPAGDNLPRFVCDNCHTIHYHNPRMVVGSIPEYQGKLLLCKRNIEPRRNRWTLPAGYLENGETTMEGARRETLEETGAQLNQLTPYLLADIPHVNQLYLMFACTLVQPDFHTTAESCEVRLFSQEEIPWSELAFEVIRQTLHHYLKDKEEGELPFRHITIEN